MVACFRLPSVYLDSRSFILAQKKFDFNNSAEKFLINQKLKHIVLDFSLTFINAVVEIMVQKRYAELLPLKIFKIGDLLVSTALRFFL